MLIINPDTENLAWEIKSAKFDFDVNGRGASELKIFLPGNSREGKK